MEHARIIVAGTFDLLHAGHESMLATAFASARHVEIWVTDDAMTSVKGHKLGQKIQPYADRVAKVKLWCDARGYEGLYAIHELHDGYGDSTVDASYTAIVCSEESRAGCEAINAKRAAAGLPTLEIVVAPLVTDDLGHKVSSTALRAAAAYTAAVQHV